MRYVSQFGPRPSDPEVPTVADLEEFGPEACLAALREEFAEQHKRFSQYCGWTDDTQLGIVKRDLGTKYTQAAAGDLVLVKAGRPYPQSMLMTCSGPAYMPRIGWNCTFMAGDVEIIREATR